MTQSQNLPELPARWYSVDSTGAATLCVDEVDAVLNAEQNNQMFPKVAPHRAVQLAALSAQAEQGEAVAVATVMKRIKDGEPNYVIQAHADFDLAANVHAQLFTRPQAAQPARVVEADAALRDIETALNCSPHRALGTWDDGLAKLIHHHTQFLNSTPPAAPTRECKCDLRTKLVGDGCDVCNPELAAELAAELSKPTPSPQADHSPDGGKMVSDHSEQALNMVELDALPLPELPATVDIFRGIDAPWAVAHQLTTPELAEIIRAARHEGYELAMRNSSRATITWDVFGRRLVNGELGQEHQPADALTYLCVREWLDSQRLTPGGPHGFECVGIEALSRMWNAACSRQQQPAQQQAGAASASLLAYALRKLLARTSGEHYPVEQELARTALSSHDDAFRQECDDADELLRMLGLDPDSCRTDGGFINMPRVRSLLKDRELYGVLSELFECFDLPYPPETAGRDAQSAWGDRRAAAKEQARAILALKATAGGVA